MEISPELIKNGSVEPLEFKLVTNGQINNKEFHSIELKLPEKTETEPLLKEMKDTKPDIPPDEIPPIEDLPLDIPPDENPPIEDQEEIRNSLTPDKTPDDSGKASPDPNCAICLGKLENKSFTDSCFHQFCFTCLLEWSKIKAQCPLCKQAFKSIIHNVRSIEDYDQYYITVRNAERYPWTSSDNRRFRYPSTMTGERLRHLAFEHSLDFQDYRLAFAPHMYHGLGSRFPPITRSTTSDSRRSVYNDNLWVQSEDGSLRYRETNPEFFRQNPACTHRLTAWLNRELVALLQNSENQVNFVLELILALIMRFNIQSSEFYEHIYPYLQSRTSHFVHEFYHYARSPYDMATYDRNASYDINSARTDDRSNNSSPNSIVEVPVENAIPFVQKPFKPHRYPTRSNPYRSNSTKRSRHYTPNYGFRNSSTRGSNDRPIRDRAIDFFNLDMPGTSSQDYSLFNRSEVHVLPSDETSKSDSEEDCVIVDYVNKKNNEPPACIDIATSSEETEENLVDESEEQKPDLVARPSRKNRCTFHYDYSSDSCSEQTSSANSIRSSSNSPIKKIKIKSFIGTVKTASIPSTSDQSSNHGSNNSHKKHKKHKKHKHKHHRHRHQRE